MFAFDTSLEGVLETKIQLCAITMMLHSFCHLANRPLHGVNNLILRSDAFSVKLIFFFALKLKTLISLELLTL